MSNAKAAINNINNSGSGRGGGGGGINGGTQACAACKYQRRKCAPDCILAPYFPHDSQRQFLNAHKLFGVSNITKIIRNLQPPLKDHAMRTIIFQSDVRAADPVGGCYAIIRNLHRQIQFVSAELDLVLQHLAFCRAQAEAEAAARTHQPHVPFPNAAADDDSSLLLHVQEQQQQSPMLLHVHHIQEQRQQQQQPHHLLKDDDDDDDEEEGEEEEEQFFLHHDQEDNHVVPLQQDIASWAMQDTASSSLHDIDNNNNNNNKQNQSHHLVNECQDFKPAILDVTGDRLELKFYLQQEENTIEQSDEAIFKGQQGHTER